MSVERIAHQGKTLAIILRIGGTDDAIRFVTEPDDPLQLGEMHRPTGYVIPLHAHNLGERHIEATHEFLHLISGEVRVELYSEEKKHVATRVLAPGDTILLQDGAHGFTFLKPSHLIEVKQGPYLGEKDKTFL